MVAGEVNSTQLPLTREESTPGEIPTEHTLPANPLNETTEPIQTAAAMAAPVYHNIPSTFIDMESVCVYQDQVAPNSVVKPALSFSHFPGNSYPGTIAPFHPEGHSPVGTYFPFTSPDKSSASVGSPYPWPMPNNSENPPTDM